MFTLKLYFNVGNDLKDRIKIVSCKQINIKWLRGRELAEITVYNEADQFQERFYITKSLKDLPADTEIWHEAYVENSLGSTTEMIKPR